LKIYVPFLLCYPPNCGFHDAPFILYLPADLSMLPTHDNIRECMVRINQGGTSIRAASALFGLSEATVRRHMPILQKRMETPHKNYVSLGTLYVMNAFMWMLHFLRNYSSISVLHSPKKSLQLVARNRSYRHCVMIPAFCVT
jgi:hypothetical protein